MEENRFFKYIWRFNAIVLMIAGLLAIGVLTFGGYKIYLETTRERNTKNIVNIQEGGEIEEEWQLGYLSKIEGTPYVMIPLNSDQSYSQSYYSKSSSSARNYLFINSQNNEKHWLFNTNKYLVVDSEFLTERDYGDEKRKIRAILYKVVKNDTDKDKRLTGKDIKAIGISMPNGKGYKEVLQDVDLFIGHQLIDKNTLLIVYQKKGVGYSANVLLSGFVLTNEAELPDINP
ncbi:hypothetical protein SAMN02746065_11715 [Desulfocicer vacuolatum DSM 3385]|uniref:Uncharacterized protein n=1 Tax=Desulfocicer vacuolatum DSM 3385 TaxID=1121400 RepID=A0A1W2DD56_9BACT|nr:hypothetical protein [Desulfocicer vacuolatum]SMC95479.1 hypothetical protein SAMN02746065_11715 [Desulfocicer vacuolatum DSM 3385]